MKITERLNVEHGVFLKQLDHLGRLLRQEAPLSEMAAIVRSLLSAVAPHCAIEEKLLRPALDEALGPSYPPLHVVDREHEEVQRMLRAVDSPAFDAAQVKSFVDGMRAHMEEEIHVLFPLAEEYITEAKLTSMCNWYVEHIYERAGPHGDKPAEDGEGPTA